MSAKRNGLTKSRHRLRAAAVRRMLASIAAVMLMLTLVSGFQAAPAFAATGPDGCATAVVGDNAPGHSAGDADEVPSDGDKATPHHHNISHSHELAVPAAEVSAIDYMSASRPVGRGPSAPPPAVAERRDLRPPIA